MEIWKDIERFPEYKVSNTGYVKNNTDKILNPSIDNNGGCVVTLYKDCKKHTRYVHRLVANIFLNNPDKARYVAHKDKNKQNNHIDNLEWVRNINVLPHVKSKLGKINSVLATRLLEDIVVAYQVKDKNMLSRKLKKAVEAYKEKGVNV